MQPRKSDTEPGDVQTLIEIVRDAKARQAEYEVARRAQADAIARIQAMIGGDGLSAIANAERRIGAILTGDQ